MDRAALIQGKAEEIALGLLASDFHSDDPDLGKLCKRLRRFKYLLKGRNVSDESAKSLLRSGFAAVKLSPDSSSSDKAEAIRLLNLVIDKLGGMTGMLGGLL